MTNLKNKKIILHLFDNKWTEQLGNQGGLIFSSSVIFFNCAVWQLYFFSILTKCCPQTKKNMCQNKKVMKLESLWWPKGQRAHILFWQSEFESRWSLQFCCTIVIKKHENKQKESRVCPLKDGNRKILDLEILLFNQSK